MVALALAVIWIWRPPTRYNRDKADPRLSALQEPFRHVKSYYFLDGGSVGVEIMDKNGKVVQIAIPSHLGEKDQYTRFYIGALHDSKPGAEEITDAADSRHFVEAMLFKYSDGQANTDLALLALRHRTSDFLRCGVHKIRGEYKLGK